MENEKTGALVKDGRKLRTVRTHANILDCCRRLTRWHAPKTMPHGKIKSGA
jgi:hypothetical protein